MDGLGLAAAPGLGQLPYVVSLDPTGSSGGSPSANVAYLMRFRVFAPTTVARMTYWVGTASGNVDLGIYSSDGVTLTRVASTGSTAASGSSATQTVNLTASTTLNPGVDYYLAIVADNGTITIARFVGNLPMGAIENRAIQIGTSFPLPTTIALSGTAGASLNPVLWARP